MITNEVYHRLISLSNGVSYIYKKHVSYIDSLRHFFVFVSTPARFKKNVFRALIVGRLLSIVEVA